MLEVLNYQVYDLKESVCASKNAFRLLPTKATDEEFEKSLDRAISLAKAGGGSGHSNFRKGIRVSFDVRYPQYWSMEFQRYAFADIVTSSSKMHKLAKMSVRESCNQYVTDAAINNLERCINSYNDYLDALQNQGTELMSVEQKETLNDLFMTCISNVPAGLELFMRVSTNYEELATIYRQRRHHRLKDWQVFCDWIEKLPYSKELIICKE